MFVEPITRSPFLASLLILCTCILVLGTVLWVVARARTRIELDLAFGATMTAMLLVSPITWDHYLLLLLIPLAIAWAQLPKSQYFRLLFMAMVIAFWTWPYAVFEHTIPGGIALGTAGPIHTVTVGSYQCYALVALFLFFVARDSETGCKGSSK
jgi:hypothetical protein